MILEMYSTCVEDIFV